MKKLIQQVLFVTTVLFLQCTSENDEMNLINDIGVSSQITPPNSESENTSTDDLFDRSIMLEFWANHIIIPSINNFETKLNHMNGLVSNFIENPSSENLLQLREGWLAAYKNWQYIEMFDIGLAEEIYFKNRMNIFPANVQRIENNIISQSYDLDEPVNFSSQGFAALDYLLFGLGSQDSIIIEKFTNSNYASYLANVTVRMIELTALIKGHWEGDYLESFINADGNTATSSINLLINDFVYYFEKGYRANKFGIPSGVFSGAPLPDRIEAFHGTIYSQILALEASKAVSQFFNGQSYDNPEVTGLSLKHYLDYVELDMNDKLSDRINAQLQASKGKITTLNANFKKQIEENNTEMLLTYDAIQSIVVMFKVDMLQKLNISVDYADADGD